MESKVRIFLGIILVLTTSWSIEGASLRSRLLRRSLEDADSESNHSIIVTNTTFLNQKDNVTRTQEETNSSLSSDARRKSSGPSETIENYTKSLDDSSDEKPNVTVKPKLVDDEKKIEEHTTNLPQETKPNEEHNSSNVSSNISSNISLNKSSSRSAETSQNTPSNTPSHKSESSDSNKSPNISFETSSTASSNTFSNTLTETKNDSETSELKTTPLQKQNTSQSDHSKPFFTNPQTKPPENRNNIHEVHTKIAPKLVRVSLEKQNSSFSILTKPLLGDTQIKPTEEPTSETSETITKLAESFGRSEHFKTTTSSAEETTSRLSTAGVDAPKNSQEDKVNLNDEASTSVKAKPFEKTTMTPKSISNNNGKESTTDLMENLPKTTLANKPLFSDPTGSTFVFTVVTEKPKPFEKKSFEDLNKENHTTHEMFISTEKPPLKQTPKDNLKQEAQVTGKIVYKKVQDLEATTAKDRKDNGRSLKVDIEKYISPEFHNKNNVYTIPTSPEIEKYLDPGFDNLNTDDGKVTPKSYFPSTPDMNDYNVVLTTPQTDIFDSRFRQVTDKIKQNLDDQEVSMRYSGEEGQDDRDQRRQTSDKYELPKLIENVQRADNDTDVFLEAKEFKNLGIRTGEMNNNREMEKGMTVNYASSFMKSSVYPERFEEVEPSNNISSAIDADNTEESASATFVSKTFVPAKFAKENVEILNSTDDVKAPQTTSKPTKKPRHQFGLHNNTIETSAPENEVKVKKIFTTTSEPFRLLPVHQTEKSTYVKPLMESPISISKRGSTKITSPNEGVTPNGILKDFESTNLSLPTTATAWTLITLKDIPNRSTEQSEGSSGYDEDDGWIKITTSPRHMDVAPTKKDISTTEAHKEEITTSTPRGFQAVTDFVGTTSSLPQVEDSGLSESATLERNEATTTRKAKMDEGLDSSSTDMSPDSQTEDTSTEVVQIEANKNLSLNETTTNLVNKETTTKEVLKDTTSEGNSEETTLRKQLDETTAERNFDATSLEKHFDQTTPGKHFDKTTPEKNFDKTTPEKHFDKTAPGKHFDKTTPEKYFDATTLEEQFKETTPAQNFEETTGKELLNETTTRGFVEKTIPKEIVKEGRLLNETGIEDVLIETTTEDVTKATTSEIPIKPTTSGFQINFTTVPFITSSFEETTFLPTTEATFQDHYTTTDSNPTLFPETTTPPTTSQYFETTSYSRDTTTYQTTGMQKLSPYTSSITTETPTTFETPTGENLTEVPQNFPSTIPVSLKSSPVETSTPSTVPSTKHKNLLPVTTSEPQEEDLEENFNNDDNDYSEMPVNKKSNKTEKDMNLMKQKPQSAQNKTVAEDTTPLTIVTTGSPNPSVPENENVTKDSTSSTELLADGDDTSETNSGVIAAIVISIVGGLCLVTLVGLFLLMKKRQKKITYRQRCRPVSLDAYSLDNVSVYNSVRGKIGLRTSKRSYGNPAFDDPVSISHQMNFPSLAKFADNVEAIEAEFEEIPQVTARATEVPPGCETKNRYANVIPLPETRVFLKTFDNDPHSDYINANYVTGPKNTRRYYIACQAPLQSTVDDFWRMIWEQQSRVILMLTNLYENGVEKCVDYLPPSEVVDCHRLFGDYQITLKKREVKEKYIISSLQLKNMVSNSWREVVHLWYLGWPEKGVPAEANSLIAFLIEARSHLKASNNNNSTDNKTSEGSSNAGTGMSEGCGPVVVHCSPGTGRTGTVLACDIAIRDFELTRNIDIPKIVYRIRRDRASAVQTKEQYGFIYKVITLYATKLTGGALEAI